MAGFVLNGMGWADNLRSILGLGKHYCKFCNSVQDFSLMEISRKIYVLFLPTITIKTQYAVCCERCKNGLCINDRQRDLLLYQGAKLEVQEGMSIVVPDHPSLLEQSIVSQLRSVCPKCGKEQLEEGSVKFCAFCGSPMQNNTQEDFAERICRNCGATLSEGELFCGECGTKV